MVFSQMEIKTAIWQYISVGVIEKKAFFSKEECSMNHVWKGIVMWEKQRLLGLGRGRCIGL